MTDKAIYRYLLSTDGINQLKRSLGSLDPAFVRMDPRSNRDMLRFLYALSAQIRFYDLNNEPKGDWRAFLEMLTSNDDVLEEGQLDRLLQTRQDWPPHLALLMSFLHVFHYAQHDLNLLPARRLNFYYQDVLRLQRRPAIVDQVHVVFEPSKNAPATILKKGMLLKAGTTAAGLPRNYALDSDYVVSQARISKLMSSFADADSSGRRMLFKANDATQVRSSETSWRPFGTEQLRNSEGRQLMAAAAPGCAIASPNLFLAEGERTVTLTFQLKSSQPVPPAGLNLKNALDISMTGETGWLSPDEVLQAQLLDQPTGEIDPKEFSSELVISVVYHEAAPSITAYQEEVHQATIRSRLPVWRMTVKPTAFLLDVLGRFTVSEVQIVVEAKGLRDLVLQNDQSLQSPDAPILPFGGSPRIGSNFYIGSKEAFSKSITSLSVNLEWQDPPLNLATHYAGYDNPNIQSDEFLSDLYVLGGKKWLKVTPTKQTLFNNNTQTIKTIPIGPALLAPFISYSRYERQPELLSFASFSHGLQQGFVRIELTGPTRMDVGNLPADAPFEAFGHKSFPTIYAQHAIQIGQGATDVVLPQPPYTPTLSSVSIDYTASDTFKASSPNHIDQFFVLDVFGSAESDQTPTAMLIPQHPQQAALYIGLENASPPQLLSLLFQFEEGSAPGLLPLQSEEIAWHYLSGSTWRRIATTDILEDKTKGFQQPGLVRLVLGANATQEHWLMPAGLHWVRASVLSNAAGAASVQDLFSQAARASLQIPEGLETDFDDHLATPLPANTVTALVNKVAAIKKVRQPYPSGGGRPSESDPGYHRRVHERLRHRDRATLGWDYERLVLEAFPEIFKVKCLPHTDAENALSPGDIKLVIVPDWRKRSTGNPLRPRANTAFLRTVEEFVEGVHTSTFSNVLVSNPVYEALLVDSRVRFKSGFDPGFHSALLEEELKRFLSPWAFEEGKDIVFGGKVHASEILAFIEGRDYVEHVTDFALYHQHKGDPGGGIGEMQIGVDFVIGLTPDPTVGPPGIGKTIGDDFVIGVPVDTAAATQPDAILVSGNSHRIGVLSAEGEVCEGVQNIGIGQMVIGLDFIIVT
jgi:hypothetical protein